MKYLKELLSKKGDPIIRFEREKIASRGIDCTTIMVVLNHTEFSKVSCMIENDVESMSIF